MRRLKGTLGKNRFYFQKPGIISTHPGFTVNELLNIEWRKCLSVSRTHSWTQSKFFNLAGKSGIELTIDPALLHFGSVSQCCWFDEDFFFFFFFNPPLSTVKMLKGEGDGGKHGGGILESLVRLSVCLDCVQTVLELFWTAQRFVSSARLLRWCIMACRAVVPKCLFSSRWSLQRLVISHIIKICKL